MHRWATLGLAIALASVAVAGCVPSASQVSPPLASALPSPPPSADPSVTPRSADPSSTPESAILVGAGDVASCGLDGDEATAALLDDVPGTIFAAGDLAYESGSAREFRACYGPTWGRHRDRTLPSPGNHEYQTPGAAGYLGYFGARAAPKGTTWYSTRLGPWHVIVLDSECGLVGGCDQGSLQGRWLAADLASPDTFCSIAIWHKPRFSSGMHGDDHSVDPLWAAVSAAGVDLVVNGHDHDYERFAPRGPSGAADASGTREFVVGTGGAALRPFQDRAPAASEVRDATIHGVLELTLRAGGYDWTFVPVPGATFTDSGTGSCH